MEIRMDSDMRRAILHELVRNLRTEHRAVNVTVDRGVVTLTGTVRTLANKRAAHEVVRRTSGVRDVDNRLHVAESAAPVQGDAAVAEAIGGVLERHTRVPDARIRFSVSGGKVTLRGEVEYCGQREEAERMVRSVSGVREVANELRVEPPKVSSADVRRTIGEALAQRAEREAIRLGVDVLDGRVLLSGFVYSWAERELIVDAALRTPGVEGVDDRLRVNPHAS